MEKQYKIVIDALGSDKGPETIILGVSMALKEFPNLSITLVGPEGLINEKIKELGIDQSRLKIIPAEETIISGASSIAAAAGRRAQSRLKRQYTKWAY